MKSYDIKVLNSDYLDDISKVFCESFESKKTQIEIKELWKQKHFSNPLGNSIVMGAFDCDLLVGINLFIPTCYLCDDKEIKVVQSCESGVLKEYRHKGIFKQIMQFAMDYFKQKTDYVAMIGFPNFSNSYGAFLKLNWSSLFDMKNSIVILNYNALIGDKVKRIFKAEIKNRKTIIKNKKNYKGVDVFKQEGISYEEIVAGEKLNAFDRDITLNLNKDYIEWKNNCYEYVSYIISYNDEKMVFILQRCSANGYNYAKLIRLYDYTSLYRKKLTKVFLNIIKKQENMVFIRRWTSKNFDKILGIKEILLKNHHNPFIVYVLKEEWRESLLKKNKWNVDFLDLD